MGYIDSIKNRRSVRTYSERDIPYDIKKRIEDIIDKNKGTLFGSELSFYLTENGDNRSVEGVRYGTYGFIKNAKAFIAGVCENSKEALTDFGFVLEKTVLDLEMMGISTCWLGGTFKRTDFERKYVKSKEEIIPCVISIGFEDDKRFGEKIIRRLSNADSRIPREDIFFHDSFEIPLSKDSAGELNEPLEMLRLAPSASNKQPWRVVCTDEGNICHFYLEKTKGYSGNKMGFCIQHIDMGIALSHFVLSCNELNIRGGFFMTESIPVFDSKREYIISWKKGVS
jgi:hypothetical protein